MREICMSRSVLLDPLVPDLRRRATSSRCRGARAGDCRDLLQQCFLRLRQIERITVGLMISGASVPIDLDQIFFRTGNKRRVTRRD